MSFLNTCFSEKGSVWIQNRDCRLNFYMNFCRNKIISIPNKWSLKTKYLNYGKLCRKSKHYFFADIQISFPVNKKIIFLIERKFLTDHLIIVTIIFVTFFSASLSNDYLFTKIKSRYEERICSIADMFS